MCWCLYVFSQHLCITTAAEVPQALVVHLYLLAFLAKSMDGMFAKELGEPFPGVSDRSLQDMKSLGFRV